jgi:hypothetical protein
VGLRLVYVNSFCLHDLSSPSTMQILEQKPPDVKESQTRSRTRKLTGAVKRPVQRLVRWPGLGDDFLPMPAVLSLMPGSPASPAG